MVLNIYLKQYLQSGTMYMVFSKTNSLYVLIYYNQERQLYITLIPNIIGNHWLKYLETKRN